MPFFKKKDMAKDKKSFVLYCEIIHTLEHLTTEQKGLLFQHIVEYLNDLNPTLNDPLLKVAFEPIKRQLKRDLNKYEEKRQKWSEAGKKSAEKRKQKNVEQNEQTLTNVNKCSTDSTNVKNVEGGSTFSTVNVNVNVNDNVLHECVINTREDFINWFNDCRKYLGLKSNIKRLSPIEQTWFNDLVKDYTTEDFKKAFASFSADEYYQKNNLIFPKNFLKPETFTKYLNTDKKQISKTQTVAGDVNSW